MTDHLSRQYRPKQTNSLTGCKPAWYVQLNILTLFPWLSATLKIKLVFWSPSKQESSCVCVFEMIPTWSDIWSVNISFFVSSARGNQGMAEVIWWALLAFPRLGEKMWVSSLDSWGGGGRYKYLKDFRSGNEGLLEPLPVDLPSCPSLATHDKDSACPVSEPSCSVYCCIAPKGASGSPWFKSHLCYEVSR